MTGEPEIHDHKTYAGAVLCSLRTWALQRILMRRNKLAARIAARRRDGGQW